MEDYDGNNDSEFSDWFDALGYMCKQIDEIDFDIALIAAGAYGMLLGNYVKSKGKQAIHIGGNLQLLFGITGGRWNYYKETDSWTLPLPEETPQKLDYLKRQEGSKTYW